MARKIVRIGGRASALAVAQSRIVMDAIAAAHPGIEIELATFRTTGDVNMKPLSDVTDPAGIKGLFTLELEQALLSGEIDLAVHSLKDVPVKTDPRLPIVAYSRRGDPRDALVLRADEGKPGGVPSMSGPIACSSARRRVQLKRLFPDITVVPVRGNVQTRLRKLDDGLFGSLVLAASGLERLGLSGRVSRFFSVEDMIPAAGQGILACQGRAEEDYGYLDAVRDRDSGDMAAAERSFVAALGGGCALPVAANAVIEGCEMTLTGLYADEALGIYARGVVRGLRDEARALGLELAARLKEGEGI